MLRYWWVPVLVLGIAGIVLDWPIPVLLMLGLLAGVLLLGLDRVRRSSEPPAGPDQ